ncbi:DUF2391 family protein [Leptodesmis sp.]|uniref:DUF2391 family protein n=1 Tax=Leptodesmis sp. TaxID=3100501 RepID=UPI0040534919
MLRVMMAIVLTFGIVFILNRTEGFRKTEDTDAVNAAIDTVEAMAIGIVCAGFIKKIPAVAN